MSDVKALSESLNSPTTKSFTPKAAPTAVPDRIAFDKAMGPSTTEGRMSTPEAIWGEAIAYKQAKEREAAAAPKKEERARDESGKFAKKEAAPVEAESKEEEHDELTVERARLALLRSGFTNSEIDAMKPEDRVKRGLKRAKALEADDEAHGFVRQAREKPGTAQTVEKTGEARKAEAPKPLDLDAFVTPLAKTLVLDEAGASTLKQSYQKLAEALTAQTAEQLRELRAEVEQKQSEAVARQEREVLSAAQVEVGKRFPDLLEPATYAKAVEVVRAIANSEVLSAPYQSLATVQERAKALLEDACQRLKLTADASDEEVQSEKERQLRSRARSSVSDRNAPAPRNPKEREKARFDAVMDKYNL